MTRYVFEKPEQFFHWIDQCAQKLLVIPREEFGKIELNIHRTKDGATYKWEINPKDKNDWIMRFKNENIRKKD